MEKNGLMVSGTSPDGNLVEIVELKNHPYFIACQFHPEFKSRPDRPSPLFAGLVKAAKLVFGDGGKNKISWNKIKLAQKGMPFCASFLFFILLHLNHYLLNLYVCKHLHKEFQDQL